jgi:hypothetical protein
MLAQAGCQESHILTQVPQVDLQEQRQTNGRDAGMFDSTQWEFSEVGKGFVACGLACAA